MRAQWSMTTVLELLVHAYPGGWSPYSRTRIRVSIGTTHIWVFRWIWVKVDKSVWKWISFGNCNLCIRNFYWIKELMARSQKYAQNRIPHAWARKLWNGCSDTKMTEAAPNAYKCTQFSNAIIDMRIIVLEWKLLEWNQLRRMYVIRHRNCPRQILWH